MFILKVLTLIFVLGSINSVCLAQTFNIYGYKKKKLTKKQYPINLQFNFVPNEQAVYIYKPTVNVVFPSEFTKWKATRSMLEINKNNVTIHMKGVRDLVRINKRVDGFKRFAIKLSQFPIQPVIANCEEHNINFSFETKSKTLPYYNCTLL